MGGIIQNPMKLSIIIPCYNVENYVDRCVESIASQLKGRDIEIIMIDDGSRDSTMERIMALQAKYPKISLQRQNNSGPATARNKGVAIAKGEYIWFVDSDDYITDNAFDILLPRLEEGYDIIAFNHFMNESNGLRKDGRYKSSIVDAPALLKLGSLYACNRIFKKDLFRKVQLPEGLINIEDFVFNVLVSQYVRKALTLSDHIYIYERTNVNATTVNVDKRHLIRIHRDVMRAHKMLIDAVGDVKDENLRKSCLWVLNRNFSTCILSLFRRYNCRFIRRALSIYSSWGVYPFKYGGNYKIKLVTFFVNHKFLWPLHPIMKKLL